MLNIGFEHPMVSTLVDSFRVIEIFKSVVHYASKSGIVHKGVFIHIVGHSFYIFDIEPERALHECFQGACREV